MCGFVATTYCFFLPESGERNFGGENFVGEICWATFLWAKFYSVIYSIVLGEISWATFPMGEIL